jgi:hypothetical protein
MNDYRHQVSGFFEHPVEADGALSTLVERGIPRARMRLMADGSATHPTTTATDSEGTLKDVLMQGGIGAAVGTGLGAFAELALVASNVSLFVASPLLAPLALMGWGASVGGLLGAAAGADARERNLASLVSDAVANGHVVLLVETHTTAETAIVRAVMQGAVEDIRDVSLLYATPRGGVAPPRSVTVKPAAAPRSDPV